VLRNFLSSPILLFQSNRPEIKKKKKKKKKTSSFREVDKQMDISPDFSGTHYVYAHNVPRFIYTVPPPPPPPPAQPRPMTHVYPKIVNNTYTIINNRTANGQLDYSHYSSSLQTPKPFRPARNNRETATHQVSTETEWH
jgi:hypothetical protein